MRMTPLFRVVCLFGVLIPTVSAADEFRVESSTLPTPFLRPSASSGEPGKVDDVIEASAMEAIGDGRSLLVAHDRTAGMFVVETATGQIIGKPLTSERFPNAAKIPPKWEGLARDEDGFFYVAGTHGTKIEEDRSSRSYLFRFRLNGGDDGSPVTIDEASVRRWRIEESLKEALAGELKNPKDADLRKIEGLAVRTLRASDGKPARRELIVALRNPSDLVRAFAADITEPPGDDAKLALKTLFTFDAGSREGVASELTSLEYAPEWKGFFALTATEDKLNTFHGNTLWFVADAQVSESVRVKPVAVHVFAPAMKAEGLCLLPDGAGSDGRSLKLAVSFDNDPHATHIPSRLQIITISRREN